MRRPWWVAAGWALDAALGRAREHHDIDVAVLRRDQLELQRALSGWDLRAIEFPGPRLRPWRAEEYLDRGVEQIFGRPDGSEGWSIDILLCETDRDRWAFKRNLEITRPVEAIGFTGSDGVSYLRPELVMLHKAVSATREPKDDEDLRAVVDVLDASSRAWLEDSIRRCRPDDPWLRSLGG
jgi:hypothetical protein